MYLRPDPSPGCGLAYAQNRSHIGQRTSISPPQEYCSISEAQVSNMISRKILRPGCACDRSYHLARAHQGSELHDQHLGLVFLPARQSSVGQVSTPTILRLSRTPRAEAESSRNDFSKPGTYFLKKFPTANVCSRPSSAACVIDCASTGSKHTCRVDNDYSRRRHDGE